MRHKKEENYEIMSKWAEKYKDGNIIINGDFNARTARGGGLWSSDGEREERKSKDEGENKEGREMLKWMEENGIGIGNGATKGDEEGQWTYVGARGCTTIDYVIRNERGREKIIVIKVGNNIKSDHVPLEIGLNWKVDREEGKKKKIYREVIK